MADILEYYIGKKLIPQPNLNSLLKLVLLLLLCFFFIIVYFDDSENSTEQYITSDSCGALGNQMFLYASLHGIGKKIGRIIYTDPNTGCQTNSSYLKEIQNIFPNFYKSINIMTPRRHEKLEIYIPHYYSYLYTSCCKYIYPKSLINITSKYLVLQSYLQNYRYFDEYRDYIKKLFTCEENLLNKTKIMARKLFKKDSSYKLCVHVRRGDFKSFGGETTEEFVLGSVDYATAYLKNKLNVKKSSIVIMGDDQDFIINVSRKLEHKTYIPKNTSRGEDICFAIHNCNSLIISAGSSTFGWWIGYLKKLPGPVFYNAELPFNESKMPFIEKEEKKIYEYNVFPKEWIRLTMNNSRIRGEKDWFTKLYGLQSIYGA